MKIIRLAIAVSLLAAVFFRPLPSSGLEYDWSGHLRANGSLEYYGENNLLSQKQSDQLFINGGLDARLNGSVYLSEPLSFHLGYEAVLQGGQTKKTITAITRDNEVSEDSLFYQRATPFDDQQLFSMTKVIKEEDDYIFYHRMDRLYLSHESRFGGLSIGRQALTWGNGLLFNPADLVNPFSPSDIIRDYKIGSDMVLYQNGFELLSDLQLVMVPRKNSDDDELSFDESTLGIKMRLSSDSGDYDVYILKNYQDPVLGAGFTTYLGDGVVRSDLTWTWLEDDPQRQSFFSAIINYDYSWSWLEKNWYGFIEFYYNGLGSSDIFTALQDVALRERLARGEIFVTGRYYADLLVQYEVHPLINVFATLIYNLEDNSFLLQPRLAWNVSRSIEMLAGVNVAVGSKNSEFGEIRNPQDNTTTKTPSQLYLILTCYF